MKKDSNSLTILCLILILIILFLVGYIIGMKTNNKEEKPNKQEPEIIDTKEVDFDLKKAELLLEEFGLNRRKGCKTIVQNEYNDTFKAIVALEKVAKDKVLEEKCSNLFSKAALEAHPEPLYKGETGVCSKDNFAKTITYSDANEIYKKMFGEDMPAESVNAILMNSLDYTFYDFLPNKDLFVKMECNGCGGTCHSKHIREIKSAKQKGNEVVITFYDYETAGTIVTDGVFNFSTDTLSTNINCIDENECISIIKKDYLEYLDEYQVKFKIINNQYIFDSLNKSI